MVQMRRSRQIHSINTTPSGYQGRPTLSTQSSIMIAGSNSAFPPKLHEMENLDVQRNSEGTIIQPCAVSEMLTCFHQDEVIDEIVAWIVIHQEESLTFLKIFLSKEMNLCTPDLEFHP